MKRLLVVSYFFPPAGGAGVQRSLKLVKYLSRFGWQCTVLTVDAGCYFATDATLLADVPPTVPVIRTFSLEAERLRWLRRPAYQPLREHQRARDKESRRRSMTHILPHRLLQRARQRFFIPDAQVGWWPFAVADAQLAATQTPFDAIWTTSSPATAHLIGATLKIMWDIPWVADFRDPWTDNALQPMAHVAAHHRLERAVVRRADAVVGVTQGIVDYLHTQHDPLQARKFSVISNGFDPADFLRVHRAPPADTLCFAFTGTFYGKISIAPFLQALSRFIERHPAARGHVQLRLAGQFDRQAENQYQNLMQYLPLAGVVRRLGYVNHATAISVLKTAHVLLLPLFSGAGAAQVMTGKIFEYLAAERPILALAEPGVAATLVQDAAAGRVVPPDDVPAIEAAITDLWATFQRDGKLPYAPNRSVIDRYSRINTTAQVAQLLDKVCAKVTPCADP